MELSSQSSSIVDVTLIGNGSTLPKRNVQAASVGRSLLDRPVNSPLPNARSASASESIAAAGRSLLDRPVRPIGGWSALLPDDHDDESDDDESDDDDDDDDDLD